MPNQENQLSKGAILAVAVLAAFTEDPVGPEIEDISKILFRMMDVPGVDLDDIALRRTPGGFYSEDVEILIGHFLAAGYAQKRSPLQVNDKGLKILYEIVQTEEAPARKVTNKLGYSYDELVPVAAA